MAQCKTAVTPLLMHWNYCSLALNHWFLFQWVRWRHVGDFSVSYTQPCLWLHIDLSPDTITTTSLILAHPQARISGKHGRKHTMKWHHPRLTLQVNTEEYHYRWTLKNIITGKHWRISLQVNTVEYHHNRPVSHVNAEKINKMLSSQIILHKW